MDDAINFTDDDQGLIDRDYAATMGWDVMSDSELQKEVAAFNSQVLEVVKYVDTFVNYGDFYKTRDLIQALITSQLSPSGWLYSFYNQNSGDLLQYAKGNSKPDWYHNLSPNMKSNFDACTKYISDLSRMIPIFDRIARMLMSVRLQTGFVIQRLTMNFYDAGFDEEIYFRINDDIKEVNELLNRNWTYLESRAAYSKKSYDETFGRKGIEERNRLYREARIKDYLFQVDVLSHAHKSFIASSNGRFTVNPEIFAKVKVLDEYTERISLTENVNDYMHQTVDECLDIRRAINEFYNDIKNQSIYKMIDALRELTKVMESFAETTYIVFDRFKNRDDEAPFIFEKQLPIMSSLNGKYGLSPITRDPWQYGTSFAELYSSAADALSNHCHDFVYNHGHMEMQQ